MRQRLASLLNGSLLSIMLLSDHCQAQITLPDKSQAPRVESLVQVDWLRALGTRERYFLLGLDEPSETRQFTEGARADKTRTSPFVSALKNAWKKGMIERGVEGSIEALIQCQREQSPALTTPFMRSDSQQAHCFRF